MSLRTCLHPVCHIVMKRRGQVCCGRHFFRLPEEMRERYRYAREATTRLAIQLEMRRHFEDNMIGQHEIVACRAKACDGKFVYLPTAKGNLQPVDVETVLATDDRYDASRHKSHFATCEDPDGFRSRDAGGDGS